MDLTLIGLAATAGGSAVITTYIRANFRLRRKGTAAAWWGGLVLGNLGMLLTGAGWTILAFSGPYYNLPALRIVGVVIALLGGWLYLAGAMHVGRMRSRRQFSLNLHTEGIYRMIRHPQALALCLLAVGIGLASLSKPFIWSLPLIAGFWVAYTYLEERFELIPAYGEEYERYIRSTGRLFPSLQVLREVISGRADDFLLQSSRDSR